MKRICILIIGILLMAGCQKDNDTAASANPHDGNDNRVEASTPRYIAALGGKIYVTCYNPCCVIRIDTATLQVEARCLVGNYHPEGICTVGNKLYIASSNIGDESGTYHYNNQIYVVDLATFTLCDSITTGYNPVSISALDGSRIVVSYLGDYASNPAGCEVINVNTHTASTLSVALNKFDIHAGNIYGYSQSYDANWNVTNHFYRVEGSTLSATEILTDFAASDHAYGIQMNSSNGDLIVTTDGNYASRGDVYIYKSDYTLRLGSLEVNTLPGKTVCLSNKILMVLGEGNWGSNDATIDCVDCDNGQVTHDVFSTANGRGLGDVAQDLIMYGSKLYATVTMSSNIEVMECTRTPHSKQIHL